MALLLCPECGGKVSSTLKACPHCGYIMPVDIAIQDPEDFLNRADYEKYRDRQEDRKRVLQEPIVRNKEPMEKKGGKGVSSDTEPFFFPDKKIKRDKRAIRESLYYEEEDKKGEKRGPGCLIHFLLLLVILTVFFYGMINYSKTAKEIYQKALTTVENVKDKLTGQE